MNQAAIPPASSPATQQLIDLCLEVAGGNMGVYPQLKGAAEQRLKEMNEVSERFFGEVEEQSEEFQKAVAQEAEYIESIYDVYGQALDTILNYGGSPKPEALQEAAMKLSYASNHLAMGMTAFEQKGLSLGPHKMPLINLFANLGEALIKGNTTKDAWLRICKQYKDSYQAAIGEIDKSKLKDAKGVPERRKALEQLVASLSRLEGFAKGTSAGQLEEEIRTLALGHDELNQAVTTFNEAQVQKPTSSPAINMVLKSAQSVVDGKMERDILRGLCQAQLVEIQKGIAQVKLASNTPTHSTTVMEEGAKIMDAMEGIEEALETLLAYSESKDGKADVAREAMKELEAATMELAAANTTIQDFNDRYGKIVCPSCSTLNVPTNRMCSQCNRQLPQMTGSEEFGGGANSQMEFSDSEDLGAPVMTDVMKELFDACEGFQAGKVSADELLAICDRLDQGVVHARETLSKLRLPPIPADAPEDQVKDANDVSEVIVGGIGLMEQGIEDCEFGIAKIRSGVLTESNEDLREGQTFYFQGCQYMWQVRRLQEQFQAYIDLHMPDKEPEQDANLA